MLLTEDGRTYSETRLPWKIGADSLLHCPLGEYIHFWKIQPDGQED